MKHLPHEYTDADQRSDTSFLVGVSYGRETERTKMLHAALEKVAEAEELLSIDLRTHEVSHGGTYVELGYYEPEDVAKMFADLRKELEKLT